MIRLIVVVCLMWMFVGCEKGIQWRLWRCPSHESVCHRGMAVPSKEECERFIKEAKEIQPQVKRICLEEDMYSW